MNAAKKIRTLIESGQSPEQARILKALVAALELNQPFDLQALSELELPYFATALALLQDWRQDYHIAARSKLVDRLLPELALG